MTDPDYVPDEIAERWVPSETRAGWVPTTDQQRLVLVAALTDEIREAIQEAVASETERCALKVPTSWLDSMLSGEDAAVRKPPYGCPDIERLLHAIAAAIRAPREPRG